MGCHPSQEREEDGKRKEGGTRVEREEGGGRGRGGVKKGRRREGEEEEERRRRSGKCPNPEEGTHTNKTHTTTPPKRPNTQNVLTRNRTGVVAATKRSTNLYTIKTLGDIQRKKWVFEC